MLTALLLSSVPLVASAATAYPASRKCISAPGNFTINSLQLYPENADFDPRRCVTYMSDLWKSTVSTYDVREKRITDVITIPGISGDPKLHVSGVQVDLVLDRLSIIADAGDAFDTAGKNIAGDNILVKYDLQKKQIAWRSNLTAVTNGAYGGFQDIEHDRFGNSFALGTFPSSLIKVSADGKTATPWYLNPNTNHTIKGFTGIAAHEHGDILLVSDNTGGRIVRFDSRAAKGQPVHVPLQAGAEPIGQSLDASYLPTLFKGTVLLVSDNILGTIVIQSKDGKWNKAEKLGVIENAYLSQGGSAVATVEMGGRVYVVTEFFVDAPNSLNRTIFPFYDITENIQKLLDC